MGGRIDEFWTKYPFRCVFLCVRFQVCAGCETGECRVWDNRGRRALTEHDRVILDDLPAEIRQHRAGPEHIGEGQSDTLMPIAEVERQHIYRVLQAVEGNKSLAAQVLGMDRRTLYRKLERFEREESQ